MGSDDNKLSEVDSALLDNYKEEAIANYLRELGWNVSTAMEFETIKENMSAKALSDFPEAEIKTHLEENGYLCYEAEDVDEVLAEISNDDIIEHLREQDGEFFIIDPDDYIHDTHGFIKSLESIPGQQLFELICESIEKDGVQSVLNSVEGALQ